MKNERGATMIIVLVVLLLIAIVGIIAMRSGVFGSRLATNTQVGNLLINSNDAALTKFEDMSEEGVRINFAPIGMYHYLLDPINATDELVFCYRRDRDEVFSMANASVISSTGATSGVVGFCDGSTFSSGRDAVITQVHMKRQNTATSPSSFVLGSTLNEDVLTTQKTINISLSAISIIPAYASNNIGATDIQDCFRRTAFKTGTVETNAECFARLNMPYEVQSTDFTSGNNVFTEK